MRENVFSLLISITLSTHLAFRWFVGVGGTHINYVLWTKTFPFVIATAGLVALVSCIIPIVVFKKTSTIKMIGG